MPRGSMCRPPNGTALVREIEAREGMKAEGQVVREFWRPARLGTERHELAASTCSFRGRCGRQGDPGSSRFYLSLEDDLMRIFAGRGCGQSLKSLGMKEGEPDRKPDVSRRIEGGQKKVEEAAF